MDHTYDFGTSVELDRTVLVSNITSSSADEESETSSTRDRRRQIHSQAGGSSCISMHTVEGCVDQTIAPCIITDCGL
jgi:hypothetical protein